MAIYGTYPFVTDCEYLLMLGCPNFSSILFSTTLESHLRLKLILFKRHVTFCEAGRSRLTKNFSQRKLATFRALSIARPPPQFEQSLVMLQ